MAKGGIGRLVAVGADQDAPDLRRQGVDDPGDEGPPGQGDEPLVLAPHAPGLAAGEDEPRDLISHRTWPGIWLGGESGRRGLITGHGDGAGGRAGTGAAPTRELISRGGDWGQGNDRA